MKKSLITILLILIATSCVYAKKPQEKKVLPNDVLAPAVQFNLEDYKDYFKKSTDYKLEVSSRANYKITCDNEIIGVEWGDYDNVKMLDYKNKNKNDLKSVIMKLKYETYTYIRLYQSTGEILNVMLNVNAGFEKDKTTNLGLCKVEPFGD